MVLGLKIQRLTLYNMLKTKNKSRNLLKRKNQCFSCSTLHGAVHVRLSRKSFILFRATPTQISVVQPTQLGSSSIEKTRYSQFMLKLQSLWLMTMSFQLQLIANKVLILISLEVCLTMLQHTQPFFIIKGENFNSHITTAIKRNEIPTVQSLLIEQSFIRRSPGGQLVIQVVNGSMNPWKGPILILFG